MQPVLCSDPQDLDNFSYSYLENGLKEDEIDALRPILEEEDSFEKCYTTLMGGEECNDFSFLLLDDTFAQGEVQSDGDITSEVLQEILGSGKFFLGY